MPLFTVEDAIKLLSKKMGGAGVDPTCEPGRSEALEEYNRINRLLMLEEETFVSGFVRIPVSPNRCFTLDRRIQRILRAKACSAMVSVVGQGFTFTDGMAFERSPGLCCDERLTFLGDQFSTAQDLDLPRLLFAVSDRQEDPAASVMVLGIDPQGNELRTSGAGKGLSIPITYSTPEVPPVFNCGDDYSRGFVSSISLVRKPRTQGYIQLWGYDNATGTVFWLTTMAPDEESPNYTRYRSGVSSYSMIAEVTFKYVPLYDFNEVSLIQQIDAYESMAMALDFNSKGDMAGYQQYRNQALSRVRKQSMVSDGTRHNLNIQFQATGLRGRTFSSRRYPR